MPCYSSPYNFLNIADAIPPTPNRKMRLVRRIKRIKCRITGAELDDPVLSHHKSILSGYTVLRGEAKEFISTCEIALESNQPGAKQVLNAARGEQNFIPGTDEEAF